MTKSIPNTKSKKWIFVSLVCLLLAIGGFLLKQSEPKKEDEPKVTDKKTYRANYHFTSPDKWKNDPQKPIYLDGKYHYYYLYNGDYPDGNGTEWRHATSTDLVHWKDEGVAIPKYTNKNGDPWSGSVVVDAQNTAGFGENSVIAIVTQPSASGQQEQFLWYSKDKGKTFKSYSDEPVLKNPGTKDFRDPKIIWDDGANKWVMLMAEGTKIGFYESDALKDWKYTGGFETKNIGLIECPDLYMMRADDGSIKWILGASANGKETGKPNTYAYWTGEYNGKEFVPDQEEPQWLDHGFDWYGGVTFEDGLNDDKLDHRYALAWMNNWDYADNTPTVKEGFNGIDSIVRRIELKKQDDDNYYLASQPNENLNELTKTTDQYEEIKVDGAKKLDTEGVAYRLEADVSWEDLHNVGLRLRESSDEKRHVDVGIFAEGAYSYVNRGLTHQPDESNQYIESKAPFDPNQKEVHLKILVDKTTVEVFIDDGKVVHSSQVFPPLEDDGITLFSEGGTATFKNIEIKHYQSIYKSNKK